ncbi:ROK family protein [Vibrio vulnificus]|nr:ROK family protein [Vibrio vulnificus]EKK9985731.1 ROK family protein [Vibrio vulnificus]ELX4208792.1 ROK family protein [Vibrio vulnificus]
MIKLGLSLDSHWIRGVLLDNQNVLYRTQVRTPSTPLQAASTLSYMTANMQRMFGSISMAGLNVMEDCWKDEFTLTANNNLPRVLAQSLPVPCNQVSSAIIALSQVSHLPKGNILSAVLDDGCELCMTTNQNDEQWIGNTLQLSWAHKPLKNYQSLIDGLTPLCCCGSDECHRQYLTQKGIERQYHQLSLRTLGYQDILQNVANQQSWAIRIYRIWIDQLARALTEPILRFQPSLLLLSGSLIQNDDLALNLKSTLSRHCAIDYSLNIQCLPVDEYRFAHGAASMCEINPRQVSTFTA